MKKDQTFDFTRTEEYTLSIQAGLDGFSFCITHPQGNRLMALGQQPATISSEHFLERRFKEWSQNHDLLQRNYQEIRILFSTQKFTIIPGELYNYEKQHEITDLLFGREQGMADLDNYIPEITGNLLFRIPGSLHREFSKEFPEHRLIHPLTAILPALQKAAKTQEHTLMLYFEKSCFYLTHLVEGELQTVNSFLFHHPNDVIYYVLSILRRQKAALNKTRLFLTGNIARDDALHTSLKNHFSNLTFFNPTVTFNAEMFKDAMHRFILLHGSCA